jgi:tetratricopeptide (TPR) repeat protein
MRGAFAAVVVLSAASAFAQVSEGDAQWAARAEGHQGAQAKAARVDAAIAAFERAIAQNPNDLEARWKLLRAFRFRGEYVVTTDEAEKREYGRGKQAGEQALVIINRMLAAKGVPAKATEKQVADAARSIPGAADVFFWDAVNWGEWALVYGKLAAVREGAADRIRREATIAYLADPNIDHGGPARVLGRLHDQTPHVPFMTGWASKREAVRFLNESLKLDPTNKLTKLFLAEALVDEKSSSAPRAIAILREVIATPGDDSLAVENAGAQDEARALLKKWGA